jgi:hypothetical protein
MYRSAHIAIFTACAGPFSSAYLPAWDLLKSLQTGPRDQPTGPWGAARA